MFKALVLVRNLSCPERLDFGEFTVDRVGPRFKELREVFLSGDVNLDDWILEKSYEQSSVGPPGSRNDIEDILLLLRLYKAGDISFIKQAIIQPNGMASVQLSNRAMNDLNSYSSPLLRFEARSEDCELWRGFADAVRKSQSWSSDWFTAARRFFLTGGAKPFKPESDDVDRILDYATALESTLVPEKDYVTRRLTRRAAAMIAPDIPAELEVIVKFVRRFYEIRSRIAHGSSLGDENKKWLLENCRQIELRVRNVLVTAVQKLPPGEEDRRAVLAGLYDPSDEDRGSFAFEKFREIKTAEVRKAIAAKIAQLAGE